MAALAEAPPLALEDDAGSWTAEEIDECAVLCERADADAARWALGDWLLTKVPVGAVAGRKTGGHRKLRELAERVDWSDVHLRGVRDTAYSWPPETRVPVAPFYVFDGFRDGGPNRAAWRRGQLLTMERGARGRVTQKALRRWRDAQRSDDPSSTDARRRAVTPEYADVLERIDGLVDDVDQLIRGDARPKLWVSVRAQLDALSGEVERVAVALSAAA